MKKLLVMGLVGALVLSVVPKVLALTCGDNYDSGDKRQVEEIIASCQQKISDSRTQQSSLKSAISLLNSKISLISAQIRETNLQIAQLEKEIAVLSTVVSDLNIELNNLSQVYISRVREAYKRRETNPLIMFFASDSFTTFENRLRYLQVAEKRDQLILRELESSRIDFDQQKTVKEQKQTEVEALKASLNKQNSNLAQQQKSKQVLLADTQNSEQKYQQLLSDARAQLAAFNTFTRNRGGASILSGTTKTDPGWGTYYNQRDSQWGNKPLGISNISVADAGCLISSMAMVMTHYNKSADPGIIASNPDLFASPPREADFLRGSLSINGTNTNRERIGYSRSSLDNELSSSDRPVILGINRYGSRDSRGNLLPEHFVVIKKKDGDDYIMNDPFEENGMNAKLFSVYPSSSILGWWVDRVSVN